MRLKEFYADYLKRRQGEDYLNAYYIETTPSGREFRRTIDAARYGKAASRSLDQRTREAAALLMEADLVSATVQETEGTYIDGPSFRLRIWSAQLDADEAKIALGIHERINKGKHADPTPRKRGGGRRRRFSL